MTVIVSADLEGSVLVVLHDSGQVEFCCPLNPAHLLSARQYRHVGPRGARYTTLRSAARGSLRCHIASQHALGGRTAALVLDAMFPASG